MNNTRNTRSKSHGRLSRGTLNKAVDSYSYEQKINDILPSTITFLNTFDSGRCSLRTLQEKFKNFTIQELWIFIVNHPTNFCVENQNKKGKLSGDELIWVRTTLELCETYCRKGKHCPGKCGKLHLCRTFLLLGDRCCPFFKAGKVCSFGHKFDTQHNANLLVTHNLRSLNVNELRILFRRRICRSVSTLPQICIYYNGKGTRGCSNKYCKALHLCLDFVKQKCHGPCPKNHSMSVDQVAYILDLFAIDTTWPNDAVLDDLRTIMQKRMSVNDDNDTASMFSTDSNDYDDHNSDTELKAFAGVDHDFDTSPDGGQCCSHCKKLRIDFGKMTEKMQGLERQIESLQASLADLSVQSLASQLKSFTKQSFNISNNDQSDSDSDTLSPRQKQILGEQLFTIVKEMQPKEAEKITGMLLDLDSSELPDMLKSPASLKLKVEEAVATLQAFHLENSK